jgi:GNAT superfamily N-acetyltransferase
VNDYTSRFLERRDLVDFLSGQLLGFALDDYFEGAYLGAFDSSGAPAGFIFTGKKKPQGEILIGVPHPVQGRVSDESLDRFLVERAARHAAASAATVVAAVYSDQTKDERIRLQEIYRSIGFGYYRDSTILERSLEADVQQTGPGISTCDFSETGRDAFLETLATCAEGSGWSDVDFPAFLDNLGRSIDPELFRIASAGGEPAGVFLARVDRLDPREGAFYFLGVMPAWRNRGIGKSLLMEGLSMLRRKGVRRTRQIIPAGEGPSLRLLEGNGYRVLEWARFFRLES